ncbi:sex-regulated protein janus-A-like [Scaptodrosophila lebanonensis]|uniref:Sex-regulated protein janus-A n=1 Tax=Drosophila lebanonensis TaxID=7225 RepID=A0A6J2T7G2_DROLE|nr:sex-regulated protein janus-A-like [Scaptodrosophila lebanonensis]
MLKLIATKLRLSLEFPGFRVLHKMAEKKLLAVPLVDIDEQGVFKYVLIKLSAKRSSEEASKTIVRGYADCKWHADIFKRTQESLKETGLDICCLGGGRIQHRPDKKYIKVYGYSQGYGKADHSETKKIIQTQYGDYEIEISDEGY